MNTDKQVTGWKPWGARLRDHARQYQGGSSQRGNTLVGANAMCWQVQRGLGKKGTKGSLTLWWQGQCCHQKAQLRAREVQHQTCDSEISHQHASGGSDRQLTDHSGMWGEVGMDERRLGAALCTDLFRFHERVRSRGPDRGDPRTEALRSP